MAERARGLERTYRVAEIAGRFAVETKTVYAWIEDDQLRAMRLPTRPGSKRHAGWRVRREDLEDFERRCLDPSSQSQPTDSDSEAGTGPSAGPTPTVVELSPFQRGRQSAAKQKSGATSS